MYRLKYFIFFTLSLFLFINVEALELDITSESAIIYNTNDNKVIYQKNENEKLQIASLTKIMTAVIVLENVSNLDEKVTIEKADFKYVYEENLATAKFKIGQEVTYLDLLYGLLLPSGADAANALGRSLGGEETFVKLMNDKAIELNLKDTHFASLIGLDNENNYSTAKDLSTLFSYAIKNKTFKTIITTDDYVTSDGQITFKSKIRHNSNVGSYLLGGKTGTTEKAGLCLASIAEDKGVNYLLITLGGKVNHYNDSKTIYEYFMNNYGYQTIAYKKDSILKLKTKYLKEDEILFYPDKDIKVYLPNDYDKEKIVYKYKGIKIIDKRIEKGKKVGVLDIYYDTEKVYSQDIILKQKTHFSVLKYLNSHKMIIISLLIIIIIFTLGWRLYGKKHKNVKMLF